MSDQNLLSVESRTETSLTNGKSETRVYVKMYVDAAKAGLIADMGAENWQTLCVIASFMDAKGECYPTQWEIANRLGISRQSANGRVKKLSEYRWQGRPLIVITKGRVDGGKWDNARYRVMPISQLRIFDSEPEELIRDD